MRRQLGTAAARARAGRLGAGLKHHLGAIDLGIVLGANNYGAKLGVRIYGVKLPAKSPPRLCRAQDLGAKIYGATNDDA